MAFIVMQPRTPFTTDGWSGGMTATWRLVLRRDPPWEGCCVAHDRRYWRGGTAAARFRADVDLMICVAARGHRVVAVLMFLAVRLFGGPYWPMSWRWAYGHAYPKGYDEEEAADTPG